MEREIWEELVDRVVDDECTDEERRALEEAAERNPEIRDAIRSALRIRELLRPAAETTVPPEFAERLRLAIDRSDFWVDRVVERPTIRPASTTGRRVGGRRFHWATTGAAISFAAVALLASNVGDGSRWGGVETARLDKTAEIEKTENGDKGERIAVAPPTGENVAIERAPRLPIRTPQNELNVSKTAPVPYADGFYTRRVLDSANARRILAAFLRTCRDAGVKYEKFGGDAEFLLTETTTDARAAILRWLDENVPEIAPRADNNFAETWNKDDENVKNVRVSFFVADEERVDEIE